MAVLALGLASAAAAQAGDQSDAASQLESLQRDLRSGRQRETSFEQEAKSAVEKNMRVKRQIVVAARDVQWAEAELTTIEEELAALDLEVRREEAALRRKLAEGDDAFYVLLRVARLPPMAMVVLPAAPLDTVRGFILFRDLEPTLRNEAAGIKDGLARLSALRIDKARARTEKAKSVDRLKNKQDQLNNLQVKSLVRVDKTRKRYHAEVVSNNRMAKDIGELIAKLAEAKQAREPAKRRETRPTEPSAPVAETAVASIAVPKPPGLHVFTGAKGSLLRPVQGRVVRLYGAKDRFGVASKGIEFESRAAAQVVAPFDGEVVFAGPFRGYGRILLIEHGGGYHTLLAGLGRIDSVPGQWLLAGEPVAVMDDAGPGRPRLYVEFRRRGQPVNPLPWMAAAQNKVSG